LQREKTRPPFLRFHEQGAIFFASALRSREIEPGKQAVRRNLTDRPLLEERLFFHGDKVPADRE
jgi:hypothetical protein